MFGLEKMAEKAGLWTPDQPAPQQDATQSAPVAPVVSQMVGYANASVGVNEDMYTAISAAIDTGPNNAVTKLHVMSETMRAAIPDEAMRIKAAAAACGLTASMIITSVDTMIANTAVEKERFMNNDIAALSNELQDINGCIEASKAKIEELTHALEAEVANRDQLTATSFEKSTNIGNLIAVFDVTSAKVLQDLDMEKKKIGIYIPEEVKP